MSETIIYEYTATSDGGGQYTIDAGNEKAVGATVTGELSPGDQFVFDGKIYDYAGGADLVSNGNEVGFFAYHDDKLYFFSTSPISGNENVLLNTSQSDTICFMAGTLIETSQGLEPVEKLAVGDMVMTAEGTASPVKWLGRQTVHTTFANPNRVLPIRIKAGALAESLPARDLLVSSCHALLIDGVLVQAGALVNGRSITREADVPPTFVYYHVELADHSLIRAEGVAAETFIDNVDRFAFDNWDEHLRLYPEGGSITELPYPRAASARQVPASILHRLESRAELLFASARAAA